MDLPTSLVAQLKLIDLSTAQGTRDFLQWLNQLLRVVVSHQASIADHETRISDLEP